MRSSTTPLMAAAVLALSGCMGTTTVTDLPQATKYSLNRYHKEYVIGPGDRLEVLVQRAPEVSRTVVVRPDGMITLPTLGDVPAAGRSFPELRDDLVKRFASRRISPEVDVIAVDVPPAVVLVVGQVSTPHPIPLGSARTAAEALAQAGGFQMIARREAVLIRLQDDGRLAAIPLYSQRGGDAAEYLTLEGTLLQADDILVVPESSRSQFTRFVDDFINKPLSGVNSILGTYVNYKLAQELSATINQIQKQTP